MTRIGKFGKTHGVNGEINLSLELDVDFERCDFILAEVDGLIVPFEIDTLRPRGESAALVSFCRMESDELQKLVNEDAFVDDEYIIEGEDAGHSPAFYVGYSLIDKDGKALGVIYDYDDSTPNILFSVNDHLVPAAAMEVHNIDSAAKTLTVTLPDGLLDI